MPLLRVALVASAIAALFAGADVPANAQAPERARLIAGHAVAVNGATLEVRGVRIRLAGIAVAADDHVCERTGDERWRCGPRALNALDALLEESIVACTAREREFAGSIVAACAVGPVDLSLWLLRNGLARAALTADAKYRKAQDEAKSARRGIWAEKVNLD